MQKTPLFQSLVRNNLVLGCERELILTVGTICASFVFSTYSTAIILVMSLLFPSAVYVLRRMADADPNMSQVYVRHIRQQSYYAARPTPWSKSSD